MSNPAMTSGPLRVTMVTRAPARVHVVVGLGALLVLALLSVGLFSLMLGVTAIAPGQVLSILLTGEGDRVSSLVVLTLRLPRFLLGALAGAALALCGTLLQDSLRNPLADPGLLGVSTGASLVVAVVVVFRLPLPAGALPWLALTGGLIAGLVILLAAQITRDPVRMILIGAALSAFLAALITVMITLAQPEDVKLLYTFLAGTMTGRGWDALWLALPWLAVGIPLALLLARPLNLLQLGDEMAEGLGLPVFRTRLLILLVTVGMAAAVVAVCGPIGFVALVAPHMARRALRTSDARQVLPIAALLGAVLLSAADLLSREILRPAELPVGLFTVALGSPVALLLLRRILGRQRAG